MTIRGEIDTDGTVRVEGKIEGTSHRAGTLIVTTHGGVVGDIEAGDVSVSGTIHGNVHATGRVEIEPGAAVHGQIRAHSMQLHEGATIHGQVSIGPTPAALPTAASRHLELTTSQTGRARI
jgi:cytoskeletal protein CcmA (bactofilin family)